MEKKENKKENKKIEELTNKIQELEEALKKLEADSNHWKNRYYQAYADTENLRKSIEKDHREALKYRAEGFVENLLPILDGFHLALEMPTTSPEVKNYLVGFTYIYNNLVEVLKNEGVEEISPKINDKFDMNTMQAVDTVEDEGEEHLIKKVNVKGYKLKDHLIRPAMVITSIHPKKEEIKEETNEENTNEEIHQA